MKLWIFIKETPHLNRRFLLKIPRAFVGIAEAKFSVAVCCSVLQCVAVCCSVEIVEVYTWRGPSIKVCFFNALHYIVAAATRCNTLQHAATRCNTLQHAVTCCNTLQHAATQRENTVLEGHTQQTNAHTHTLFHSLSPSRKYTHVETEMI